MKPHTHTITQMLHTHTQSHICLRFCVLTSTSHVESVFHVWSLSGLRPQVLVFPYACQRRVREFDWLVPWLTLASRNSPPSIHIIITRQPCVCVSVCVSVRVCVRACVCVLFAITCICLTSLTGHTLLQHPGHCSISPCPPQCRVCVDKCECVHIYTQEKERDWYRNTKGTKGQMCVRVCSSDAPLQTHIHKAATINRPLVKC